MQPHVSTKHVPTHTQPWSKARAVVQLCQFSREPLSSSLSSFGRPYIRRILCHTKGLVTGSLYQSQRKGLMPQRPSCHMYVCLRSTETDKQHSH